MARHYKVSEPTVSRLLAASRRPGEVHVANNPDGERIAGVLPVAALDERLAVVDTSGTGKTYATKGLVERLMQAGARVCVVDPLGVWWGLRLAADGTTATHFPVVVFGGRHPPRPAHGTRGFVPWLITQRPAVLHNDVLSQADILVSMKLISSQDRAAVGRWIEGQADQAEGRRILAALPRLGRGEGWVWAPSDGVLARVAFPRIQTFDSSGAPQRTERLKTVAPAPLDLSALAAALTGYGTDDGQARSSAS